MAMRRNVTVTVLATMALALNAFTANADIFVWTDEAGVKNVSNLPPPEGSRGVSVTRSKPMDPAQEAALREAVRQAEMRALDERMKQLEAQADQARREAAQAIAAAAQAPPAPAAPAYVVVVAPSPPAPAVPPPAGPCDYPWSQCAWGFWPGFYSPGIVVVGDGHPRARHRPVHHDRPRYASHLNKPPARHPFPIPKPNHWRK